MIRFACPVCRKVYKAEDDHAGRKAECKKCGSIVLVPEKQIREIMYGVALPSEDLVEAIPEPDAPAAPEVGNRQGTTPVPPVAQEQHHEPDPEPALNFDDEPENDWLPPNRSQRSRRARSGMVDAVAIMNLVIGLLNFACAVLILAGVGLLARIEPIDNPAERFVIAGIVWFIVMAVVLLGIPDVIAAYGIWHRRYWGYVLGLVLAGIHGMWAIASILWHDPWVVASL